MDQLKQLQHLSLVNKVTTGRPALTAGCDAAEFPFCTLSKHLLRYRTSNVLTVRDVTRLVFDDAVDDSAELENHLGISEKTLAEFIINLASGTNSVKEFQKALVSNKAEMPESLVQTLWNVIQRLTQVCRACTDRRISNICLIQLCY